MWRFRATFLQCCVSDLGKEKLLNESSCFADLEARDFSWSHQKPLGLVPYQGSGITNKSRPDQRLNKPDPWHCLSGKVSLGKFGNQSPDRNKYPQMLFYSLPVERNSSIWGPHCGHSGWGQVYQGGLHPIQETAVSLMSKCAVFIHQPETVSSYSTVSLCSK